MIEFNNMFPMAQHCLSGNENILLLDSNVCLVAFNPSSHLAM